MSEHDEQVALFQWAALNEGRYDGLALMYAIPNGGQRHKAVAAQMKREGVKAGVLDVCLPVARGGYHGLYIEMKFGNNHPTAAQARYLEALNEQGYYATVCWSWNDAVSVIVDYYDA